MNTEKAKEYWEDFEKHLASLGIKKGDILYVGSDVASVLLSARHELELSSKEEQFRFLDKLIDSIQEAVSEEGTLLFPVYSWDFCRGKGFDYKKTQGEVGVLNNYILNNRSDFKRTQHPIYSFMVWGKDAGYLAGLANQEAWGEASPFKYLLDNDAKQLNINVGPLRGLTFKHYVEQVVRVPYRYPKYFIGSYTDENGVTEDRVYSMYVRDLGIEENPVRDNDAFSSLFVEKNTTFRDWDMFTFNFKKLFEVLKEDFLNNGGKNVYDYGDYKLEWKEQKERYEVGFWRDRELVNRPE